MLFNSLHYLFFLPIVVAFYFLLAHKYRWILLLAASYYFYMCWKFEYAFLIMASTLIDYYAGIQMGKCKEQRQRKKFLLLSILVNVGLLFAFKYFNFFNEQVRGLFDHFNIFYDVPLFDVLLPVGISFYTFQTLSYSIDVYRGVRTPEKHLGIFALYVSFFPQLVAGPIEKSTTLLPQLREEKSFNYTLAVSGLKLILWGFFKKLVVADRLAIYVDFVFANTSEHSGLTIIAAAIFFSFQVYCDFSAYSDIAIGTARIMGYKLSDNFKRPYLSRSMQEFWQRWHITLMSWFRDYLYIPLGGNRVSKSRWYLNIMIVFAISGLWHGADWTFIGFGSIHGIYLLIGLWTISFRKKINAFIGLTRIPRLNHFIDVIICFILVCYSEMIFRSNNIKEAFVLTKKILTFDGPLFFGHGTDVVTPVYGVFAILILISVEIAEEYFPERIQLFNHHSTLVRHLSYATVVLLIILTGVFDGGQFIYFAF